MVIISSNLYALPMEHMEVSIIHLLRAGPHTFAIATATAEDAEIRIAVRFSAPSRISHEDLIEQARDEILRFLDIK